MAIIIEFYDAYLMADSALTSDELSPRAPLRAVAAIMVAMPRAVGSGKGKTR